MQKKIFIMWIVVLSLVFISQNSGAQEKLAQEKLNVIKVIDSSNVDQEKNFLPYSFYFKIKNWKGSLGEIKLRVVPSTTRNCDSPGYKEATKKYSHLSKIGPDKSLHGWVAGLPFPVIDPKDPDAAYKIVANFHKRYWIGDDFSCKSVATHNRDKHGRERVLAAEAIYRWDDGRVDIPPLADPKKPEPVDYRFLFYCTDPYDVRGLSLNYIRYTDPKKEDDQWMYIPASRRIRRASTAQRYDSYGGTDMTWDDFMGWAGKMELNTYKLIGEQEIYATVSQVEPVKLEGLSYTNQIVEKRPCYIIEVTPKDPNYVYSKRIWWIDKYSWDQDHQEIYDKAGKLWKDIRKYYNYPIIHFWAINFTDIQAEHASPVDGFRQGLENNIGIPVQAFSLAEQLKRAR